MFTPGGEGIVHDMPVGSWCACPSGSNKLANRAYFDEFRSVFDGFRSILTELPPKRASGKKKHEIEKGNLWITRINELIVRDNDRHSVTRFERRRNGAISSCRDIQREYNVNGARSTKNDAHAVVDSHSA